MITLCKLFTILYMYEFLGYVIFEIFEDNLLLEKFHPRKFINKKFGLHQLGVRYTRMAVHLLKFSSFKIHMFLVDVINYL